MTDAARPRAGTPCECEKPGPFYTGVPGTLAMMQDDRVAPGAVVERCDLCERFRSDADAFQRMVDLGLVDASKPSCAKRFTVHCFVAVRVKFPGVLAANSRDAAQQTLDRFDWDTHCRRAEFADEITAVLVDSENDADYWRSVRYDAKPIEDESCADCAWILDDASERKSE